MPTNLLINKDDKIHKYQSCLKNTEKERKKRETINDRWKNRHKKLSVRKHEIIIK